MSIPIYSSKYWLPLAITFTHLFWQLMNYAAIELFVFGRHPFINPNIVFFVVFVRKVLAPSNEISGTQTGTDLVNTQDVV